MSRILPRGGEFMTMSKPSTGAKHRLLVSTAMLGVLCLGYGRRAYAACSGAGGTYNCTGALTATQTLSSGTLSVTTTAPFSISTTAGDAFDLTATTGSLTFTDNNTSTITGFGSGISATNNGSGDLMITTTGTVTGNGAVSPNAGIYAKNYGGNLTVNTATVSGGRYGIYAKNYGSGALSITATGTVTGSGAYGVSADNHGTSLTINVGSVTGAVTGIGAGNFFGRGLLSITSTGTVRGNSAYGIAARGLKYGVTIQAANVYGATSGIFALTYGGALSITTTGTVTGSGTGTDPRLTSGIYARVGKYATALTIKTYGPVTGAQHGIFASFGETDSNEPTGALSITAGGSVTGLTGSGIYAANFGLTGSSTSITVTKTGFVQGKVAGVTAYSLYNGAPISITNFGKIQNLSGVSSDLAIRAYGGPITVINNGTITGVVD
jgi:autotransporter family porin